LQKSPEAFLTIGEMAKQLNVKTHILRYWEEQFPMLQPLKRAGGRRLYRPDDVALLTAIYQLLNNEGYTIKGARKFLTDNKQGRVDIMPNQVASMQQNLSDQNGHNAAAVQAAAPAASISIASLKSIHNRLSAALAEA
jgi:DNA-binding transcriptional MerR regulator